MPVHQSRQRHSRFLVPCAAAVLAAAPAAKAATLPPYEPIRLQRIDLPPQITDASTPTWTQDGHHLLFSSQGHLWLVGETGQQLKCLTCGIPGEPPIVPSEQEALAYAFPDGRRAFFGPYGIFTILECHPSLLNCTTAALLPVDLSAARPTVNGVLDLGGGAAPHLAPDGRHLAFSDIRSDALELMIVGTLQRGSSGYVLTDPRVVNPPNPTSITDTDEIGWSAGTQLHEFKSFADGGASATYVGEDDHGNPDVYKVNLKNGRIVRLTSHPDWDEDNAPSPDGTSMVLESDRTMHRVDMSSLLPVRSFLDAPITAALATYYVGGPQRRECDLQPWLLPASGDHGAALLGQPLLPYNVPPWTGGDIHGANNISGAPQWSPDGTKIVLNTQSYDTTLSAPYIVVAHLTARAPTHPLPVVNSQPGLWAVPPANFLGSIALTGSVTVAGRKSGTAVVSPGGTLGAIAGDFTVTYTNFSDDGRTFYSGAVSTDSQNVSTGATVYNVSLTATGEHNGSERANMTIIGTPQTSTISGTETATLDGFTISGPPRAPSACPNALPGRGSLTATIKQTGGQLHVHVESARAGAGVNELRVDQRPVWSATVQFDGQRVLTDTNGNAVLPYSPARLARAMVVTAGDTFAPLRVQVPN